MGLVIPSKTWKIMKAIPYSLNAQEIAEKSNVSYNSVLWFLNNARGNFAILAEFDWWRIGLTPLAVLTRMSGVTAKVPPYTFSISEASGLKKMLLYRALLPERYIKRYLRDLDADIVTYVKGYDIVRWFPFSELTQYIEEDGTLQPLTSKIYEIYNKLTLQEEQRKKKERVKVDIIDLYIMRSKMRFSYTKLSYILGLIHTELSENMTKQLLSYHYNKHVKPLWKYNFIIPLQDQLEYPFRLYYFKGKDSEILAKLLVKLPYVFLALLERNKVFVLAQPTPHVEYIISDIVSMFDVRKPLGDILISLNNYTIFNVNPKKLFFEGKWIYPDSTSMISVIKEKRTRYWK